MQLTHEKVFPPCCCDYLCEKNCSILFQFFFLWFLKFQILAFLCQYRAQRRIAFSRRSDDGKELNSSLAPYYLNARDGLCEQKGTLRSNDADDNENVKKTMGLISKTTTSHVHNTYLYISVPFLHDYDVKTPNFAFYGGRKQATTKSYSLSELEFGPLKFSFRRVRLQLTK